MPKGKVHRKAYFAIYMSDFSVFGSVFIQDIAEFVKLDARTIQKYLNKGSYKGWMFRKQSNFRYKKG